MNGFNNIKIESPYNIKYIEDVKFDWKPNEHASFYLKGIVEDSAQFNAVNSAGDGDEFTLYEGEEDKTIFKGQTSSVKVTNVNGIYYIELKGISGSFNLDQSKKSRSFQDENMEYGSLISQTIKDYSGSNFMQYVGEGEKIGNPIIQYKETAWEFLKRMASKFNSVIVCDIMENKPRFYFGLPERRGYTIDEDIPYTASKDIKAFEETGAAEAGLSDIDFFSYEIESGEQYFIGNEMNFRNKNLVVTEVHGYMDRGLFKYKYKLSRKEGLYCQEIKNKALSGAAFDGKILAVQGQTVRMHLNIDSEQVTTKAHWFPFAPPTGNMMYCMPKVGTSARLYFPNSDPENAEVTGSVRDNGGSCAKTGNPNNRYFGTEHGSELAMLPNEMSISGNKSRNLLMSMKNDTGLDFTSHKKIVLNAAEGVYFKTPKKVIINGENSILVTKARQKKGFSLEGEFNFLGANSKIEAKDRTTYPDFNDEPKEDKKAKAAAIAKKKAEAEKKSGFNWGKFALCALAAVAVVAVVAVAVVVAPEAVIAGAAAVGEAAADGAIGGAIAGAVIGAVAGFASTKGNIGDRIVGALKGAAKGGIEGAIVGAFCGGVFGPFKGLAVRLLEGGSASALTDALDKLSNGQMPNPMDLLKDFRNGMIFTGLFGGLFKLGGLAAPFIQKTVNDMNNFGGYGKLAFAGEYSGSSGSGAIATTWFDGIDENAENLMSLATGQAAGSKGKYKPGTGEYGDVGGHHIHAKAAFKGDIKYDPNKGFCISQDFMKKHGWNHADMTSKQRQLFKELYESGRPNTLEEQTRIAKEALKAGGATEEEANELINESLENLRGQGVEQPTRIPWYSK